MWEEHNSTHKKILNSLASLIPHIKTLTKSHCLSITVTALSRPIISFLFPHTYLRPLIYSSHLDPEVSLAITFKTIRWYSFSLGRKSKFLITALKVFQDLDPHIWILSA